MEAVECGAAAVGIILSYYGRYVPLPELRRECGVSRNGSKASYMVKAAKNYGLQATGYRKDLDELQKLPPPYIVFWNFSHYVVVEGFGGSHVYINDPASGSRTISIEEFDQAYTGVVLAMSPGPDFVKGGDKPSPILSLWKRLQGSLGALFYAMIVGFFLTIIGLIIPVFSQIFVDDILIQERQFWLRPLLLAIAITTIIQGWLTLLRLRYLRRLKIKLAISMSSGFLWHILRLPVSFYSQRFAGEISNRINLNDQVAQVLSGQLATTLIDAMMVFFYALVMVQYDWVLTVIVVSFAIVNIFVLQKISRQRVDANQRLIQEYGKAAGASIAGLQNIETLKASGLESDFFGRWSGYYTKALNSQQELGVTNQIFLVLPKLLSGLSVMLLLVVGGFRVMNGHLSIGMLVAFQGLMQSFQQPINNLLNFGATLQELEGNLIRLDDVLNNPIDPQLAHKEITQGTLTTTVPKLQGYVELRNLTFGYSSADPPVIANFHLSIKPGQRIALVGGSGSGKSTIAKLIAGVYQPWEGEIYFDGQPRSQITYELMINSVGMVEQDIQLFSGTVRENLTLWDGTIPEKNLIAACEDAAIADVISSLPGGYDATLSEGAANLSQGQRQRLEIARALVNNPSVLILDEATSALDVETEKIIDENLRRRGCTCIIVAHRLSTIRDCDEIIVLQRGKVVQRGRHQELWHQEGVYSQLLRTEGEAL
ncbi:NHLP family bacteriocin export ABC transporter peptidase/permease/ATPase subunit [Nostoc sp. FACHB-152]|uniref:NHLP family bacteriocin export ABC transporter peptidase/permease/ATPase subunit n=1 Tax=unclassified Nostoc TaxID=2593658 RepID=UPI001689A4D8|nr:MULTISPECIES: NHLP family bacteriocin export ABC transporter peptidase/permease/ATPase subunit [unclassified Nostoc]MBD2445595.1 NHLP family bacteriocin export ABC transporter peptidase/permease/ATPase subunit [Nostoc sp. FACHB-152]MBD2466707.1 NHLP family bacteriocin export ABC transporter peptidase/permease/ATPase subunit [Nostoc sp. FACHB-145]